MNTVIFNSTGAIGDTVIASALQEPLYRQGIRTGIVSKPFTLSLWQGLENVVMASSLNELTSVDADVVIIDLRNYLRWFPHSTHFPSFSEEHNAPSFSYGHLCQWMVYEACSQNNSLTQILSAVSSSNVRIVLTNDEAIKGRDYLHSFSNGKPLVVLSHLSTTKNRNIPKQVLEETIATLKDSVSFVQLQPYADHQQLQDATPIGSRNLREVAAYLLAADMYIGVDSGPLHIAAGVVQGSSHLTSIDGLHINPSKILVVVGSSQPIVVTYQDNTILQSLSSCQVAPCGAHGYVDASAYSIHFQRSFYGLGSSSDLSACILPLYRDYETSLCMASVTRDALVDAIQHQLRK